MENETDIINRVLNGNKDDFAVIIRAHQRKIFFLCLSLLRSPAEAEDAVQDVFIKAYNNLKKFRFKSSFSTWLYRIAYHRCIDIIKEKAEKRECVIDRDFAETAQSGVTADERELIDKTLDSLPAEHRAILVMREGSGMSYEEIAEIMNISVDAVSARLWRARNIFSEIARRFLAQGASKG